MPTVNLQEEFPLAVADFRIAHTSSLQDMKKKIFRFLK